MQVRPQKPDYGTALPRRRSTCAAGCLVAPGKLQESFRSAIPAEGWWGRWRSRSQRLLKRGLVSFERGTRGRLHYFVYFVLYFVLFTAEAARLHAWMFGWSYVCYQTELVDALCLSVRSWRLLGLCAWRPFEGGRAGRGHNAGWRYGILASP